MDNDSDDSDMNDPGSLSMEISKENKELEVHPVEENNTPTFIHAHQENTTDDRNVNLETPSIQPIEDMIESMFNQSNTKEYQKKVKRFVFDELFQKVKFITSDLFHNRPIKNNVLKHIGLTEFPEAVKEVWWTKYNNVVRKTIIQKRNNLLGDFKKKFLGKSGMHTNIMTNRNLTIVQN